MKRAGLLTNGGDTCSLNALLKFARDALVDEGFTVYGFEGGYRGLITNRYRNITDEAIDPNSGGTFLLSLRDSPTPSQYDISEMEMLSKQKKEKKKAWWKAKLQGALNTLKENDIDLLVVLGGNGTIAASASFAKELSCDHKIICLPRTIDNDLDTHTKHNFGGREINTALCPGYPSAATKIIQAVRDLRTTARSTRRIFAVETMGRDAGWLALAAALGWAEVITIPEVNLVSNNANNMKNKRELIKKGRNAPQFDIPITHLCERVVEEYKKGDSRNVIIAVSEGTMENCTQVTVTQYGSRKLGGASDAVNYLLKNYIKQTGVLQSTVYPNIGKSSHRYPIIEEPEVRPQHTDYSPRMGKPCGYDVKLAWLLAYKTLRLMVSNGGFGMMPVLDRVLTEDELEEDGLNATKPIDINSVSQILLPVDAYYDTNRLTSTKAFDDFLYRIVGKGIETSHKANI